MTTGTTRTAIWLRIFCAALLLSLGLAHRPVDAAPRSNPASSNYLLPDGTFAGLCIGNADRSKPEKPRLGSGCDVCRLAAAVALPSPPAGHSPASREFLDVEFALPAGHHRRMLPRPGSPVRGPPSQFA